VKIPLPGSKNIRKTTDDGHVVSPAASSQTQTRKEKLTVLGIGKE
jgi:hypothetical protein